MNRSSEEVRSRGLRLPGELRAPLEELMALPLAPRRALGLPLVLARQAAGTLRTLAGADALRSAAGELRNKGEVYATVRRVRSLVDMPRDHPPRIAELVERAGALGPFRVLWAIEGLGHAFAASFFAHGAEPRQLLLASSQPALPRESLPMLHAGIGLAFAEEELEAATPWTDPPRLEAMVDRFLDLCRDSCRPAYLGAALESLGLVTALFHPPQVPAVDRALGAVAPEASGYFWHGVGRATYFAPLAFVPGSAASSLAAVHRLAPDPARRRHAVAGFAWGVTMVNLGQPRILEDLLLAPEGERLLADGAFANGVASSLVMRTETTPEAPFVARFCEHRPSRFGELWEEVFGRPSRSAVERYRPVLARAGRLGEIFRAGDLEGLVGRLEAGEE